MSTTAGKRKEKRIEALNPIRLWGMDANGRPFIEAATTLNVSRSGVLLNGIPAKLAVGDTIAVKFGERKCRFRVVWLPQPGTAEEGHIGLQSLEPEKHIWDMQLPSPSIDIYSRPERSERRLLPRLNCSVSAEVGADGAVGRVRAFISDISLCGCYVSMSTPFALEARITVGIWLDERKRIWSDGLVISNHQGFGIGIKFLNMSRTNLQELKEFLDSLPRRKTLSVKKS
jgi:hypothetical protein